MCRKLRNCKCRYGWAYGCIYTLHCPGGKLNEMKATVNTNQHKDRLRILSKHIPFDFFELASLNHTWHWVFLTTNDVLRIQRPIPASEKAHSQLTFGGTSPARRPPLPVEHARRAAPWPPHSPHTGDNEVSEGHCLAVIKCWKTGGVSATSVKGWKLFWTVRKY